ncbi:MAG TPA: COX15/CtaA family protein [Candidatus Dormibacteraeota bacterium]|nr:COX15/CtaA family protein [Candidatus Dormibacteraeota bacterium]
MKTTYHPGLHIFAVVVAVCTFLLLIAGALVTSNDAALSVPDWPLSYGTLTPPMVGGIVYEHSHRVIAAMVGLMTVVLAIWVSWKEERRWVQTLAWVAVGVVIAQGALGGLTVLLYLHYGIPVAHACLAQIFFASVLSLAVFTSRWWISEHAHLEDHASPSIHALAIANAAVIYFQVVLGAGFRHQDIPVWPHIVGAFVVMGMVTWTAVALRRRFESSREMSKARILLHAIFGIQFLLGFGAYWARLRFADVPQPMLTPVILTVIHTVVGALLFAASIFVTLLCYRLIPRSREAAAAAERQVTV